MALRFVLTTLLLALAQASAATFERISVTCSSGFGCTVGSWDASGWTARASLNPSQNETGWATLLVETPNSSANIKDPLSNDKVAAFAAGYAEGLLTAELIWMTWASWTAAQPLPPEQVKAFVDKQVGWVSAQVLSHEVREDELQSTETEYWHSVGLVYKQLAGIAAGYNFTAEKQGLPTLSLEQIMLISMNTELGDIQQAVNSSARPDFSAMSDTFFFSHVRRTTHCSALFRVTPAMDDLLAAHTTWTNYFWMLRLFKGYTLRFSTSKAATVMFSGYPGAIAGIDDFYTTSQKLVIIETTNNVFNTSLYDLISASTVPYWIRVTVATRSATHSKEWHDVFYRYNSGTYNNQWMVADYKKFMPGQPMPPWTFSISEQLPGPYLHPAEDATMSLQRGHWASYNVPYFEDVYEISGYPAVVKQRGPEVSYQLAPRAPIFRRDAEGVNSLDDLHSFMRENNYGTGDPLAKTACHAIACRGDLLLEQAEAVGATDAKAVNRAFMQDLAVSAIAGPTTQKQPPFAFTGRWASVPHFGLPQTFDFQWQTYNLEALSGELTQNSAGVIV